MINSCQWSKYIVGHNLFLFKPSVMWYSSSYTGTLFIHCLTTDCFGIVPQKSHTTLT